MYSFHSQIMTELSGKRASTAHAYDRLCIVCGQTLSTMPTTLDNFALDQTSLEKLQSSRLHSTRWPNALDIFFISNKYLQQQHQLQQCKLIKACLQVSKYWLHYTTRRLTGRNRRRCDRAHLSCSQQKTLNYTN